MTHAALPTREALKRALEALRPGEWLLVEHARPELLGVLVEALKDPELEVHTELPLALDPPAGATRVLVPRVEDVMWLEVHWLHLAQQEGRGVLFCDTATTLALAERAARLMRGVTRRVTCPRGAPGFAVEGLRKALAARAPGVVWRGGNLRAAFAEARPRGVLHELSAAWPYAELLKEVRGHRREWIAWTGVNSPERLRRVRWVLAQAGHRTRTLLVEPTVEAPGWWPVHGRQVDVREARRAMEEAGASLPGRMAALNELEPEALEMQCEFLRHGLEVEKAVHGLSFLNAPEGPADPSLQEMSWRYGQPLFLGRAEPPAMRLFSPSQLRALCQQEAATLTQRLEAGEAVETEDLASWVCWTMGSGPDVSSLNLELAIEQRLWRRHPPPEHWTTLARQAVAVGALDAAECWASSRAPGDSSKWTTS